MDFKTNVIKFLEKHIQDEGLMGCTVDCFCHPIKKLLIEKDDEAQKVIIRCQDCNGSDDTVEWTNCPYQEDVNDTIEEILVCSSCYYERGQSI